MVSSSPANSQPISRINIEKPVINLLKTMNSIESMWLCLKIGYPRIHWFIIISRLEWPWGINSILDTPKDHWCWIYITVYPYCIHCWSRPPLLKRGFGGLNFPWAKEPERSSTSRSVTYRMLSAAGLHVCVYVCIICLYIIFYILNIQYMCGILIYTILYIYYG